MFQGQILESKKGKMFIYIRIYTSFYLKKAYLEDNFRAIYTRINMY